MYRIHTAGYDAKEKITIAKKYLIPKIEKNVNFKEVRNKLVIFKQQIFYYKFNLKLPNFLV